MASFASKIACLCPCARGLHGVEITASLEKKILYYKNTLINAKRSYRGSERQKQHIVGYLERLSDIPMTEFLLEFTDIRRVVGRIVYLGGEMSICANWLLHNWTMMQQKRSCRRHNEEVDEACIADIASNHEIDVEADSTDEESEASSDSESEAYFTDNESDLSFSTDDFNWPDDDSNISDSSRSGDWSDDESSISDSSGSGNWTEEESGVLFSSDEEEDEV